MLVQVNRDNAWLSIAKRGVTKHALASECTLGSMPCRPWLWLGYNRPTAAIEFNDWRSSWAPGLAGECRDCRSITGCTRHTRRMSVLTANSFLTTVHISLAINHYWQQLNKCIARWIETIGLSPCPSLAIYCISRSSRGSSSRLWRLVVFRPNSSTPSSSHCSRRTV